MVSAPIGSALMAVRSSGSDPASSSPITSSTTGASEAPNVVHTTTPRPEVCRGR
ncbi:hypothetical protein D3C75_1340310 [compost metagenome]